MMYSNVNRYVAAQFDDSCIVESCPGKVDDNVVSIIVGSETVDMVVGNGISPTELSKQEALKFSDNGFQIDVYRYDLLVGLGSLSNLKSCLIILFVRYSYWWIQIEDFLRLCKKD